ncbi:hypothetical protein LR48_Vigan06g103600 [Vigna angularis]|uniref:Uncharacterized protein n=1 Tax=Phaseolus angularis TaxID=3914 RepID=A0A0L9US77_PHAAN|nr:hypothetical protein LR48_Vigan06g103600 [Vigna angularis]
MVGDMKFFEPFEETAGDRTFTGDGCARLGMVARSPVDGHGCSHGGEDEDGGRDIHGVWTRTKALWWRLAGLRVVADGVVERRCLRRP